MTILPLGLRDFSAYFGESLELCLRGDLSIVLEDIFLNFIINLLVGFSRENFGHGLIDSVGLTYWLAALDACRLVEKLSAHMHCRRKVEAMLGGLFYSFICCFLLSWRLSF